MQTFFIVLEGCLSVIIVVVRRALSVSKLKVGT